MGLLMDGSERESITEDMNIELGELSDENGPVIGDCPLDMARLDVPAGVGIAGGPCAYEDWK